MKKWNKVQMGTLGKLLAYYGLAFVIAFAAGLVMYAAKDLSPFGDRSVLCMDLWGQYFPMYEQNASADTLSNWLYSWNGGLGYNNWAQNAYYCNSIFLWILPFLSSGAMVTAMNWICLFKISFSACTCLIFLTYYLKRRSPIFVGGAVAYSLCSYMLAFLSQPMWTDALIYAPLVLLGLERLIREKKPVFYMVMLALTMISSFYIGFALCIFLAAYFVCDCIGQLQFRRSRKPRFCLMNGKKALGMTALRFAGFSVLAAAISAFVLIPVAMAIGHTIASEGDAPEKLEWYANITEYIQCMLPGQRIYLEYKGANIAVGILVFLMVPLYFFNRKVRTGEKIGSGIMLSFLFVSMNANVLNYLWHGFHFPNQLPCRWSFLLSLYVILLCCSGMARLRGLTPVRMLMGLITSFALVWITSKGLGDQPEAAVPVLYWILLLAAAAILMAVSLVLSKKTRTIRRMIRSGAEPIQIRHYAKRMQTLALCGVILLAGIQIFDSSYDFVQKAQLEQGGLTVSELSGYADSVQNVNDAGNQWKCGTDEFYRTEMNYSFTFNPSMMGDYHGMSYYSSTMNGDVYRLMRYLGNRVYAENVSSVYNTSSVVQDSLFGIRYYLDSLHGLGSSRTDLKLVEEGDPYFIWENPTALSVAYAVSSRALDLTVTDEVRSIQNQNTLLNCLYGEEINVYQKMITTEFHYENASLQEDADWNVNFFLTEDLEQPVKFYYAYTCEETGTVMLEHNFRAGTIQVELPSGIREVSVGNEKFCNLGVLNAGDVIRIEVDVQDIQVGCCGMNLYRLDEQRWQQVYERLSAQQLQVDSFEGTSLEGTITMEEEGLVLATIPQDGGWTVYCDGEKADAQLVGDTLMAVRVPTGTHTLRYVYTVRGLKTGLLISLGGVLIALWFGCPKLSAKIWKRRKQQKPEKKAASEIKPEAEAEAETKTEESASEKEQIPDKQPDSLTES